MTTASSAVPSVNARAGRGEVQAGDTPWPETRALYAAEVTLTAPAKEGMYSWTVTFTGVESEVPHEDAAATFNFRTVRPADHGVTVTVAERGTDTPPENVQVRLGVYRASTDECGRGSLEVPTGDYDLYLQKVGYEMRAETVEVTESVSIQVEAVTAPDPNPDDEQVLMYAVTSVPGATGHVLERRRTVRPLRRHRQAR